MTADLDGVYYPPLYFQCTTWLQIWTVYIIHHFTFSARHDSRSGRCIVSTTLLSVHDMTPDLDGVYYPPLYFQCTTWLQIWTVYIIHHFTFSARHDSRSGRCIVSTTLISVHDMTPDLDGVYYPHFTFSARHDSRSERCILSTTLLSVHDMTPDLDGVYYPPLYFQCTTWLQIWTVYIIHHFTFSARHDSRSGRCILSTTLLSVHDMTPDLDGVYYPPLYFQCTTWLQIGTVYIIHHSTFSARHDSRSGRCIVSTTLLSVHDMTPDLDGVYYPPLYFQCTTWLQIWTARCILSTTLISVHDMTTDLDGVYYPPLYFQCTTWLQIWTVYIIHHFTFRARHNSRSGRCILSTTLLSVHDITPESRSGRCILSTTLLSVHDMTPDLDGVYYPPLYFQCTTWLQIWTVYSFHHFTFSARHDSRSGRCILSTTLLSVHDMTPDLDGVYYPPLYFQCTTWLQIWTMYIIHHFTFCARHDCRSGRCILSTTLLSVHDMTPDLDGVYYPPLYFQCTTWLQIWTMYIIHHFTFCARHDCRSGRCILSTTLLSVHDMTPDLDGVYYPPLYFQCTTWLQIWTVYIIHHFTFRARHDSRSGRCILSTTLLSVHDITPESRSGRCILSTTLLSVHDMTPDLDGVYYPPLYFQCTTWLQIWTMYIIHHFTFCARHDCRSGRCILSTTLLSVHDMTPDLDGVYYPPLYFQCTTWLQIWTVYIIHHFTFRARHDSRSGRCILSTTLLSVHDITPESRSGRCILSTTLLSVHDMTPDLDGVYYPPLYFQCTTWLQIWTVYSFHHFNFSARHDSRSGRCILSTTLLSVHDITPDLDVVYYPPLYFQCTTWLQIWTVYIIHHFTFSARHDSRSGRCILSTTLLSVHDMTPDLDVVYYPPLYFQCMTWLQIWTVYIIHHFTFSARHDSRSGRCILSTTLLSVHDMTPDLDGVYYPPLYFQCTTWLQIWTVYIIHHFTFSARHDSRSGRCILSTTLLSVHDMTPDLDGAVNLGTKELLAVLLSISRRDVDKLIRNSTQELKVDVFVELSEGESCLTR